MLRFKELPADILRGKIMEGEWCLAVKKGRPPNFWNVTLIANDKKEHASSLVRAYKTKLAQHPTNNIAEDVAASFLQTDQDTILLPGLTHIKALLKFSGGITKILADQEFPAEKREALLAELGLALPVDTIAPRQKTIEPGGQFLLRFARQKNGESFLR